jgi:diguanylate cyclase (GGDEF)-like protein
MLGTGLLIVDATERKRIEAALVHQASHDSLSHLPNRALFMDRLGSALARARRQGSLVAVLFVDLDNFKVINDSLGHSGGDALIVAVARRIQACVRPHDIVARLGGDEFTLLVEGLAEPSAAVTIAERIVQQLQVPVPLAGREVFTTASIGIALGGAETARPEHLLRDADSAMYQAKANGKASYVIFDRQMGSGAMERVEMESDLRRALKEKEFRVCYQPVVELASGKILQAEALLRWEHPRHGLVAPARFVPILEETGLIVPVGWWVLEEACRQARLWERRAPGEPPLRLSVNLSPRQLQEAGFAARLRRVLRRTGLPPDRLELEITESVVVQAERATLSQLERLKALGVRLAIDDFCTGYASIAYLRSLSLDTVKIDRSFVSRLVQRVEDQATVRAILALAQVLDLEVIAEGVETDGQAATLLSLGCGKAQGYYFARPVTSEALATLLATAAQGETPFAFLNKGIRRQAPDA